MSLTQLYAYTFLIKNILCDFLAYLDPPLPSVALLCSFLLGFGDSCYNTQIYSLLGGAFAKRSTEAFSIFKFTQVSIFGIVVDDYFSSISIFVDYNLVLYSQLLQHQVSSIHRTLD
jgi:hypothetical protein